MEHKWHFLLIGIIKIGKALKHQKNTAILVFYRIKIARQAKMYKKAIKYLVLYTLNFISIFVGFESQTREKKITLETMTLT